MSQTQGASVFQKTAAKTIFYGNNGGGRDTYISSDNGGLCVAKQNCKAAELGNFMTLLYQFHPLPHSQYTPSLADL